MRAERWEVGDWEPLAGFEQRPTLVLTASHCQVALTSDSLMQEESKMKLLSVAMVSWVSTPVKTQTHTLNMCGLLLNAGHTSIKLGKYGALNLFLFSPLGSLHSIQAVVCTSKS